jgi:hypothetical protein
MTLSGGDVRRREQDYRRESTLNDVLKNELIKPGSNLFAFTMWGSI